MLTELHQEEGEVTHRCEKCGAVRRLKIHPRHGHLAPHESTIGVIPCATPGCNSHEYLRRDIPAWEAGEGGHPGSLLGLVTPLANGLSSVVEEHTVGYGLAPQQIAERQLIRALQRHPDMAEHAPLRVP